MAHACSGAGHQYGGSGQYKSHHGRPTRVSLVSQMSQMSDIQLQAYNETMQEIKEEVEEKEKVVNNTSWLRQWAWNHKQENEEEFDLDLPVIEEVAKRRRCIFFFYLLFLMEQLHKLMTFKYFNNSENVEIQFCNLLIVYGLSVFNLLQVYLRRVRFALQIQTHIYNFHNRETYQIFM